jgi:translation elongation factor EF-Ts
VCCETDFSQRNDHFQKFVGDVVTAAFLRVPPPPGPGIHSISIDAMSEQSLFDDKVPLKL